MNTSAPKRLTALHEALRLRGFAPPPYRYLREAAIDGLFPATQVNNIWHYEPTDIAVIERALRAEMDHAKPNKLAA